LLIEPSFAKFNIERAQSQRLYVAHSSDVQFPARVRDSGAHLRRRGAPGVVAASHRAFQREDVERIGVDGG
jgi:hypothetical protein